MDKVTEKVITETTTKSGTTSSTTTATTSTVKPCPICEEAKECPLPEPVVEVTVRSNLRCDTCCPTETPVSCDSCCPEPPIVPCDSCCQACEVTQCEICDECDTCDECQKCDVCPECLPCTTPSPSTTSVPATTEACDWGCPGVRDQLVKEKGDLITDNHTCSQSLIDTKATHTENIKELEVNLRREYKLFCEEKIRDLEISNR